MGECRMYQKIIELLRIHGYIKNETAAGPVYVKTIGKSSKGVFVSYDENPDGSRVTQEEIEDMIREGKQMLGDQTPVMVILLSEHGNHVFLDPEHQFDELYGPVSAVLQSSRKIQPEKEKRTWAVGTYKATILIFAVNLILFILSEVYGDIVYYMGASRPDLVLYDHQFYRLLTSNYLHFGWDHFYGNMVTLIILGTFLERIMGSLSYFLLYTGSGILGSLISAFYYEAAGEIAWSAGASGAIYGIIGGLIALLIFRRERIRRIDGRWLAFVVFGSLFHGFQSVGTDNAAHIGGCVSGFILAVLLHVLWTGKQE